MELALKSDFGVFLVEFSGAPEGFFDDYTNLFEETLKEETINQGQGEQEVAKAEEQTEVIDKREEGKIDE